MKTNTLILIVITLILLTSSAAHAVSFDNEERHGFYAALNAQVGYEFSQNGGIAGGGGARLGYGVTDDLLLAVEFDGILIGGSSAGTSTFLDVVAKAQYYIWKNLYFTANIGPTFADLDSNSSRTYSSASKTGLVMGAGFGYEMMFSERFFVAPELQLIYHRVGGLGFAAPMLGAAAGLHF